MLNVIYSCNCPLLAWSSSQNVLCYCITVTITVFVIPWVMNVQGYRTWYSDGISTLSIPTKHGSKTQSFIMRITSPSKHKVTNTRHRILLYDNMWQFVTQREYGVNSSKCSLNKSLRSRFIRNFNVGVSNIIRHIGSIYYVPGKQEIAT